MLVFDRAFLVYEDTGAGWLQSMMPSFIGLYHIKELEILKLSESLKKNQEFQRVYKNGKSYANKYLVMYVISNDLGRNRIGVSVSKKVGNSVVRHRLARLIRESFRLNGDKFQSGMDIVVIARNTAKGKNYWDISSAVMHLGKLHNILDEKMM